jgi:hypothetical protein
MKELKNITPEKSKTDLISEALEEYINKKRREKLLSLKGKIEIEYDWKIEEERELLTAKEEVKGYWTAPYGLDKNLIKKRADLRQSKWGKIMQCEPIKVNSQIWTGSKRWLKMDFKKSFFCQNLFIDLKIFIDCLLHKISSD